MVCDINEILRDPDLDLEMYVMMVMMVVMKKMMKTAFHVHYVYCYRWFNDK